MHFSIASTFFASVPYTANLSPLDLPGETETQLVLRSDWNDTPVQLSIHSAQIYKEARTARSAALAGHADADGFSGTAITHKAFQGIGIKETNIRVAFSNESNRFMRPTDRDRVMANSRQDCQRLYGTSFSRKLSVFG